MMKLYLISQTKNNDYDTYDSAVVACFSENEARAIHPRGGDKEWWNDKFAVTSWALPGQVNVQLIGDAAEDITRGVICASFNAG